MTTYQLYRFILKLYTILLLFTYLIGTLDLLLLIDNELQSTSTHSKFQAGGRGTRGGSRQESGRGRAVADDWLANNPGWGLESPPAPRAASSSCSKGGSAQSDRASRSSCSKGSGAQPASPVTSRSPSRSPTPPPRPSQPRRARIESDEDEANKRDKEPAKEQDNQENQEDQPGSGDEELSIVKVVRPPTDTELVPLVGPRGGDEMDPALRALGRRPITEYRAPRPIKRDPSAADESVLPDTTTLPKVARKSPATRKHTWSHDIRGNILQNVVSFPFTLPRCLSTLR